MRIAALVLGIVGGVFGIIFALIVLAAGSTVSYLGGGSVYVVLSLLAMAAAIVGIIGGALANRQPLQSGLMLLICGVVGFLFIGGWWLITGPCFIVGGILELISISQEKKASAGMGV